MKKSLLTIAFLIGTLVLAQAQKSVTLNAYGAYAFDDKFDTYYSSTEYVEGKIKGGFQWGLGVEMRVREDMGAELIYFRQDTEAPVRYYRDGDQNRTIDLGVNYVMVAGNRYLKPGEKVEPYGGLMLGMAIFSNKNPRGTEETSAVKFAWGARLGTNIWFSEKAGLKLQAEVLSAVQSLGGGIYFGTGGAGAGVSSYSTLYQFKLGGGIVFKVR